MTYSINETLHDMANEAFDDLVFDSELLEAYNNWPDSEASDLLYSIVDEMEEEALEAISEAFERVAFEHKQEFSKFLKQKWACPNCSDPYGDDYAGYDVVLVHERGGWTCPRCGCFTSAPEEDICFDLSERE